MPRPHHPGGPDQQGQRFVGRAEAGREQMEIDIEEHDGGSTAHPVQHRLGSDEDRGGGDPLSTGRLSRHRRRTVRPRDRATAGPDTSPTSAPRRAATSSRNRDTPARSVFMRNFPQAAQTQGALAPTARASQAGPVLGHGRTAGRALGQFPAGRTGQKAGPARPVVETHQGPAPRRPRRGRRARQRARRTNSSENRPLRGSAPRRSTRSTADQPALSAATGSALQRPAGAHHGRRAGRGDDAGTAGPPGPFGDDVDRAVGRRALLPVGLVVGIEDEGGRQLGQRGPGRGPASDHNRPARTRGGPVRRGRVSPPHQAPTEALGPADRGNQDEHPSGPGHRLGRVDHRQHEVDADRWSAESATRWMFPPPPPGPPCRRRRSPWSLRPRPAGPGQAGPTPRPTPLPLPRPRPADRARGAAATPRRGRTGSGRPSARPPTRPDPPPRAAGPSRTSPTAGGARRPRAG